MDNYVIFHCSLTRVESWFFPFCMIFALSFTPRVSKTESPQVCMQRHRTWDYIPTLRLHSHCLHLFELLDLPSRYKEMCFYRSF